MADVEDLLTQAQDSFFENNLEEAERICKQVISLKPAEEDAYSLLCVIYTQLGKFGEASSTSKEWGRKCSSSVSQIRIQVENGFMVDDTESVTAASEKLITHHWKEPVGLFIKSLAATLCADMGEAVLAGKILNSCEGENMEEDEEDLVDLFVAWTELRIGNDRRKVGVEGVHKILASENVHYRGLAAALLLLDHLNEGALDSEECQKLLEENNTSEDANILGVRALIHAAKGGSKTTEWKKWMERGALASNVLIKKKISKIIYTYSSIFDVSNIWKLLNSANNNNEQPAR